MSAHRLGPETERAASRATARRIKGDVWIKEIRNIVPSEIKIPLKNFDSEGKRVEVLDGWTFWIVDDPAILPEADPFDFLDLFTRSEHGDRIVKLTPRYKINCQ